MTLTGNVREFDELREDATGWRGLLDGLRRKLDELPFDVRVQQVKEKFGGLRVYVDIYDEHENSRRDVDYYVDAAEGASFMLCYLCGAGATHRGSGHWVRYFCDDHDTGNLR